MRSRATQTGAQDQIVLTPLAQFLDRMEVDSIGFWLPEASGRAIVAWVMCCLGELLETTANLS